MPVPDPVPAAPQHHEVLDHLLAQVVVDAVDLVLAEQGRDVVGQPIGALQVLPKGLLHNDAVPASARAQNRVTPITPPQGVGPGVPWELVGEQRGGYFKGIAIFVAFKMVPFLC